MSSLSQNQTWALLKMWSPSLPKKAEPRTSPSQGMDPSLAPNYYKNIFGPLWPLPIGPSRFCWVPLGSDGFHWVLLFWEGLEWVGKGSEVFRSVQNLFFVLICNWGTHFTRSMQLASGEHALLWAIESEDIRSFNYKFQDCYIRWGPLINSFY